MNLKGAAACLVVFGFVTGGALPLLATVGGYEVTGFSDGAGEKNITFSETVQSEIVFLAIPRATNLSEAQIAVSAAPSTAMVSGVFAAFSTGSLVNLTDNSTLRLGARQSWWDADWHYALELTVNSGSKARTDIIVEATVNFSAYWAQSGLTGKTLDESSIRIVEYNQQGNPVVFNSSMSGQGKYEVPSEWTEARDYRNADNANIVVDWLVSGSTPAGTNRIYRLYFDDGANGPKPTSVAKLSRWMDVIFANWNPYENFGALYHNNNGAFSNTSALRFPTHASAAVETGDFNGDGYLDIVFANWRKTTNYSIESYVYKSGPGGMDTAPTWYLPTNGTFGCGVGDVSGDGIDDIIFAGLRSGSNYTVGSDLYYGALTGPSNATKVHFYTEGATDAAVADVNRDGLNDIIFANAYNGSSGNIYSTVYLNNGIGFNSTPDIFLPAQNPYAVEAADINRDGWVDIVLCNNRNTSVSGPSQYDVESFVYYGGPGGFNSTPDVRLPTHGALDAKVADLNQDGWPDVIFANYNDGATFNTLSAAYFGGPSGFSMTPGAYFQTSFAYGVDVGDVNNDGYADVAFANYFDGVNADINSTVFIGPCIGLKQPTIFLPTHGAGDVRIADVDRYYMSKDKNPPIIDVGGAAGIQGPYVARGTFTSAAVPVDENLLSASAVWNATLPSAPAGCAVNVSLSNDAGATWTQVQPGALLNFTAAGKSLRYNVELFSDSYGVGTPVFRDITITYTKESYPYNVTLDLNSDGRAEWSWPGKFNTTAVLNESTMGLRTYLEEVVPRTGSGLFQVLLKFSSEKPGILRVYGVNITGNYRPEAIQELPDFVMTENIPLANAFNVKNYFRHLDYDPLKYSTRGNRNVFLNISEDGVVNISTTPNWYGAESFLLRATDDAGEWAEVAVNVEVRHVLQPPRFIAAMPNVTVEEGDTVFSAFNLLDFVFDPDNPKTSLIFSVADISNPNISVSMDINDNIEVRSKAGWDGVAVVKMKVSDGELSAIAAFNVTVVRHNRPPVIGQLPPVQLEQDGSLERSFNLLNFTTDTDTPRQNLTFRIDDNTNPRSGVSVSTDGWVNIRPDKGWSGTAIIVVNVSDGEYGVRASFTVTITPKAVTPVPVPAQDNTMLFYILILLVVVMMAFLAVDIGMRLRRPGQPPLRPSAPSAPEPGGPAVVVKKVRARPAEAPAEEEAKAPGGTPPIEVQPESPAPEAPPGPSPGQTPPAQSVQQAAEAPAAPQYGPPTEGISPAPESGAMAPVPSSPEAPPESVPDMTPGDGFTEAGQAPGEPETMDMDRPAEPVEASYGAPEQGPEQGPPAPEIGAGEVEQRPSAQSAASLLAALQKPVPKLESEGPGPAPEPASGAPPAPGPPPEAADIGDRIEAAMVSKATESEHDATEVEQKEDVKPITRVRCAGCRAAIPIFSAQRPLVVTCPQCGRMGMLK